MQAQLLLLLWLASAVGGGVVVPSTSLETLPVVYMGGNAAPRPPANLAMLAKMRCVVVEKWEGSCWTECLKNTSKGAQCEPSCREEDAQVATLRAAKALNPAVAGVFYLNTILDFHFLDLHRQYADADALIRNVDGTLCSLINDNGMKNTSAFDFSKPVGQQLWLDAVKRLVATGFVDGFYGDTMQVYAEPNSKTGNWELCKKSHGTCCEMNASTGALYNAGKNATMQAAYDFLGSDAVFFKLTNVLAGGGSTPGSVNETIQKQLRLMPYVHINHGDQKTNHDPADVSSTCSSDEVAAFMLAVEPGAFLGCNGWDPDNFGKPLGDPSGPAQVAADGTLWRNFSSGTSVLWSPAAPKGKRGRIQWAGDAPTPAPQPTPTPQPTPAPQPPQPTASCPQIFTACGWQNSNVGQRAAGSWSECCDACRAHEGCAKWVFKDRSQCVLHGASATHSNSSDTGKICGTIH